MSIQKKVIIAILLTGFIALSMGGLVTYHQVRKILTEAIGKDFVEIAKKTAERIDAAIKEEINTFRILAEDKTFIMAVKARNRRSIEDYLSHYMRREGERDEHISLFVVDGKGKVIGDGGLWRNYRPDQSGEPWWKVTYSGGVGKLYVSDIYIDPLTGNRALDLGIPILDPATGKAIGAIRSVMNVDVFFRFIKEMSFGTTGHGMLVDSEGTPLICSLLPLVEHSMNRPLIDQITQKKSGWAIAEDDAHGGRGAIVAFSPLSFINSIGSESLGGHRWYTFIRQAPEETFSPVNRLMLKVILLEAALVLTIGIVGLYIVRRLLLRPVSILYKGVERIGKGDFHQKIEIHTGDELEDLANGFNRMSEALKGFYEDLEGKVKERTAALLASETKYRALMEQAYDAVFLINPTNGQIMEVNLQAEILTGLPRERLLKINYWDLYPRDMVSQAIEQFNKGVKRGFSALHNVEIRRENGETAWVDISARLIEFNNMKVYHTVMKDITERKKEEEKLSRTNEQLARSTMVMLEQDTRLATLREEIHSLLKQINMSELLNVVFRIIADKMEVREVALFELTGGVVRCIWTYGLDPEKLQRLTLSIEEDDPVNDAIQDLRVVKKGDLHKKSRIDRYFKDWVLFPLRGRDRVIGVLVVERGGIDIARLQPLVDIASMVLEKEDMIKRIRI